MSADSFIPVTLDASLDDIDDLPGFATFPSGAFTVLLEKIDSKVINNHPAVEVSLKLIEMLELAEPLPAGEAEPKEGDVQSIAFMLDNMYGAGKLKEFLMPIGVHLGKKVISEILAEAKGLTLVLVQKRKHDKEKDRYFPEIKKIDVL